MMGSVSALMLQIDKAVSRVDGSLYVGTREASHLLQLFVHITNIALFSFQVQVAIQKCKGAARCLCAVMVQVDDDVYILDRCVRVGERTHPLELYTYINGEITDSLHIYRSDYGNTFQVYCTTFVIFPVL